MKETNIEKGINSQTGKVIVMPSPFQEAVTNALSVDADHNKTHMAALELGIEAIKDESLMNGAAKTLEGLKHNLEALDILQFKVRADRSRTDPQKMQIFLEKSQPIYDNFNAAITKLTQENAAAYAAGVSQLFSQNTELSNMELSMVPALAKQLGSPNGKILTETESETRISLFLMSQYPGLLSENKLLDPTQDAASVARDADQRFSPGAADVVSSRSNLDAALRDMIDSTNRKRSQLLPDQVLQQLKNERV